MGMLPCCTTSTTTYDDYFLSEDVATPYSELHRADTMIPISPSKFVRENKRLLKTDYTIKETLGNGTYGVVYKAIKKSTEELRAIKKIKRINKDENLEGKLIKEIDILKHLDHPNIMKIYEFYSSEKEYFIVSEYIPGGELFDAISQRKCFSESDAAFIMMQLIAAISYCHSRDIVHRDLKPENILINSIEGDKFRVKIIDFGTALISPPDKVISRKVGSIYYVAPEILMGNYTGKCDIWSLGVIMYVLLSGRPPFNGRSNNKIMAAIVSGTYKFPSPVWDKISSDAKDLIMKMLTYDPDKRITAAEAYNHPWLETCARVEIDRNQALEVLENIKGFHAKSKLQKAAMLFIVTHLMSKEEKDELTNTFLSLDKDADGKISYYELVNGYAAFLGGDFTDREEAEELLKELNVDKDKLINYSDFLLAVANKKELLTLKNVKQAFELFDSKKTGYILPNDVKLILGAGKKLDEKVWKGIIAEVDTTGNGKISYKEFESLMMKYAK